MKHRFFSVLLAAVAASLPNLQAQEAAPVKQDVQVTAEVENVSRDNRGDSHTETKRLKITLHNRSKEPVTGSMNWKLLGRDVQSRDLKAVGGDVAKVNLAGGETKVIEGVPVAFIQKEGKTTKKSGKKGGSKTAPDTGVDYKGYFVEVYDAKDELIGGAYSPGMKDEARDLFVRAASKPPVKKKKK
ncbi:MAG: hypothetical protein ACKO2G_03885 [Verrucomicrobiales bacterium]